MSKYKHIYVTGDSFSFGQELCDHKHGPSFFDITPQMRNMSYTGLIAKEWQVTEITNTSYPGGSNDRIFRMIISDLPVLFSKVKPEEIFVFISMTHASRREFFDKKLNKYSTFISNFAPPKENKAVYSLWENYVLNFDHHREQAERYVSQLLSIQAFLKGLGIDNLITRSMNDDVLFTNAYSSLPAEVLSLIDKKHFPDLLPFNNYCGRLGLPFGPDHHPLEDGHAAWAKYLMQYMQTNNIGEI